MTASIAHLHLSRGGVPKSPVLEAEVTELGLAGDGHNFPDIHGGPERALCILALERIEALSAEGHPIAPGTTGENVTTTGLDWESVQPGSRYQLGSDVTIEITRFTTPCKTIAASFARRDFNRIHHATNPGWSRVYARVLTTGVIRPGDSIVPLDS